jgi:hypothetical protein
MRRAREVRGGGRLTWSLRARVPPLARLSDRELGERRRKADDEAGAAEDEVGRGLLRKSAAKVGWVEGVVVVVGEAVERGEVVAATIVVGPAANFSGLPVEEGWEDEVKTSDEVDVAVDETELEAGETVELAASSSSSESSGWGAARGEWLKVGEL